MTVFFEAMRGGNTCAVVRALNLARAHACFFENNHLTTG